jgi:MoaA/NifB/PqqE/SkfB family radical SAM enzyme
MHQSQFFNSSLLMAFVDVFRQWGQFKPRRSIQLIHHGLRFIKANRTRKKIFAKEEILVPPMVILSVTMQCNLACKGCYSRDYPRKNELSLSEIDRIFVEAQELGITFFVITGGEPLMKGGLLELCAKHHNLIFMFYTNGAFINQDNARLIAASANIIPFISIEGSKETTDARRGKGAFDNATAAMARLKETKTLFGFSAMVDKNSLDILSSDSFYDDAIDRGCKIGLCVGFVPSADSADMDLLPSREEQTRFRQTICSIRKRKRIVLLHMPDDEYDGTGSCMAASRGFVHINAQGFVEPCPFSHIATDSVASVSLKQALASPLFSAIRGQAALLTKPLQGCALFEHRNELSHIIQETGAIATETKAQ